MNVVNISINNTVLTVCEEAMFGNLLVVTGITISEVETTGFMISGETYMLPSYSIGEVKSSFRNGMNYCQENGYDGLYLFSLEGYHQSIENELNQGLLDGWIIQVDDHYEVTTIIAEEDHGMVLPPDNKT
jgi:hypothetical protein